MCGQGHHVKRARGMWQRVRVGRFATATGSSFSRLPEWPYPLGHCLRAQTDERPMHPPPLPRPQAAMFSRRFAGFAARRLQGPMPPPLGSCSCARMPQALPPAKRTPCGLRSHYNSLWQLQLTSTLSLCVLHHGAMTGPNISVHLTSTSVCSNPLYSNE
jgi:hypothetical protein